MLSNRSPLLMDMYLCDISHKPPPAVSVPIRIFPLQKQTWIHSPAPTTSAPSTYRPAVPPPQQRGGGGGGRLLRGGGGKQYMDCGVDERVSPADRSRPLWLSQSGTLRRTRYQCVQQTVNPCCRQTFKYLCHAHIKSHPISPTLISRPPISPTLI